MMRVVLTEITRLHGGYCCIAGICHEDGLLYRLSNPSVMRTQVISNKWRVGTELEGTFVRQGQDRVHIEDSRWQASQTGMVAESYHLKFLFEHSVKQSLESSLGITGRGTPVSDIRPQGCSIVTVRPISFDIRIRETRPEWNNQPSIRATFKLDNQLSCVDTSNIPVNDIRFFKADGGIDSDAVRCAQRHVESYRRGDEELFIRVGLTRPYAVPGSGEVPKYWLQVDGLHFFRKIGCEYTRDFTSISFSDADTNPMGEIFSDPDDIPF